MAAAGAAVFLLSFFLGSTISSNRLQDAQSNRTESAPISEKARRKTSRNSPAIGLAVLPPHDLFQIGHVHVAVLQVALPLEQVELGILVRVAQGVAVAVVLRVGEVVVVVTSVTQGELVDVVSEEVDGAMA